MMEFLGLSPAVSQCLSQIYLSRLHEQTEKILTDYVLAAVER
jgi:hypothetical protein